MALTTRFVISCPGWSAGQLPGQSPQSLPLTYRFSMEQGLSMEILYFGVQYVTSPLRLSGNVNGQNETVITIAITDVYGSTTISNATAMVYFITIFILQ